MGTPSIRRAGLPRLAAAATLASLSLGVAIGCASPVSETSDSQNKETRSGAPGESQNLKRQPYSESGVDWAELEPIILLEQTRVEVETHLERGTRSLEAHRYADAESQFRGAAEKARRYPDDVDLQAQGEEAAELAAEACRLKKAVEEPETGDDSR